MCHHMCREFGFEFVNQYRRNWRAGEKEDVSQCNACSPNKTQNCHSNKHKIPKKHQIRTLTNTKSQQNTKLPQQQTQNPQKTPNCHSNKHKIKKHQIGTLTNTKHKIAMWSRSSKHKISTKHLLITATNKKR